MKTKEENPNGLHQRYLIKKYAGMKKTGFLTEEPIWEDVDPKAEYFVMRLDNGGKDPNHINACRIGIHAYADAIEPFIPQLAKDLRERYPVSRIKELESTPNVGELDLKILNLKTLCELAGVPESVVETFSNGDINMDDINWAKNKIAEHKSCLSSKVPKP